MPPSSHSSSSHSSSHSSHSSHSSSSHSSSSRSFSSHSASSHSSSSHSSSYGSSRPSSHSSSSHSYGSYGNSRPGSYGSSSRGGSYSHLSGYQSTSSYRSSSYRRGWGSPLEHTFYGKQWSGSDEVTRRMRHDQPQGYTGKGPNAPVEYHCQLHDYVFYPLAWTDSTTKTRYEKGYYDENGKYYPNVQIKDQQGTSTVTHFICEYCHTELKAEWTTGEKPTCPNCSAQLSVVPQDTLIPDPVKPASSYYYDTRPRTSSVVKKALGIALGAAALGLALSQAGIETDHGGNSPAGGTSNVLIYETESIFVEEIGRNCPYDAETENYYDQVTDCYFWINDQVSPPIWQYWYEGISSDYGDYGWMEYDEYEQQWYIEADAEHWIKLPAKYDTKNLWYIHTRGSQKEDVVSP